MTGDSKDPIENDLDFLNRKIAEALAALEKIGGESAQHASDLRYLVRKLVAEETRLAQSGYYSDFEGEPLDAVLICLLASGEPMTRKALYDEIVKGGFNPMKGRSRPLSEAVSFQIKANDRAKIKEDKLTETLYLTDSGVQEARALMKTHGPPPRAGRKF